MRADFYQSSSAISRMHLRNEIARIQKIRFLVLICVLYIQITLCNCFRCECQQIHGNHIKQSV